MPPALVPQSALPGPPGEGGAVVGPMGQGDRAPAVSAGLSHLSSGIPGWERHLRAWRNEVKMSGAENRRKGWAGAGEQEATRRYSGLGRGCGGGETPSTCSPRADAGHGASRADRAVPPRLWSFEPSGLFPAAVKASPSWPPSLCVHPHSTGGPGPAHA